MLLLLSLLLLGMLAFGLGLLVLALLLLGMVLLFALLLVLCVNRSGDSEKQRQNGSARDSNYLHTRYLHYLLDWFVYQILHVPTWILESEWKSPKEFRIHRTTAITTTPFNIDLMDPCMGMKRFTSHRRTPTTTRTSSN
jgi:hypothetical protein